MSRPALKRLKASIDFENDQLCLFGDGSKVDLSTNAAGQYVVDLGDFPKPSTSAGVALTTGDDFPKPSTSAGVALTTGDVEVAVLEAAAGDVLDSSPSADELGASNTEAVEPTPGAVSRVPVGIPGKREGGLSRKQLRSIRSQVQRGVYPVGEKYAVVEVFSPPRVVPQVERLGLHGLSIDLQTGWDLRRPETVAWVMGGRGTCQTSARASCPVATMY